MPNIFHKRKAKKIWNKFFTSGLDAVILTEHVFKKPGKSYKVMMENKPIDSPVTLIPGVECLSKEGIDFLVWSDDIYIYQLEQIMEPKLLSIGELLEFVQNDPKLYGSIAHPYVPSDTAVMYHYGEETLMKLIDKAKVVEKHNYALYSTRVLFDIFLPFSFKKRLMNVEYLPDLFTDGYAYTGGSDAHTVNSIGPYLEVDYAEIESINHAIIDPHVQRKMITAIEITSFEALVETLKSGLIVLYESIKKRGNLYSVDKTYFSS